MPTVIMSETSRHHCLSNSATSRDKGELHILSQQYLNIVVQETFTYTITHLGSLATLYTFLQKNNQKTDIILNVITFVSCYIFCNDI